MSFPMEVGRNYKIPTDMYLRTYRKKIEVIEFSATKKLHTVYVKSEAN